MGDGLRTCTICGKTEGASSCIETRIRIEGVLYRPIPYSPRKKTAFEEDGLPRRCPECGVLPGGFHHVGCPFEFCPKCGGRWLSCKCFGIKVEPGAHPDPDERSARVIPFPVHRRQTGAEKRR